MLLSAKRIRVVGLRRMYFGGYVLAMPRQPGHGGGRLRCRRRLTIARSGMNRSPNTSTRRADITVDVAVIATLQRESMAVASRSSKVRSRLEALRALPCRGPVPVEWRWRRPRCDEMRKVCSIT